MKQDVVNLKIQGGKKLSGSVVTNTSKNGTMGVLAASLLNKGVTRIHDIPKIEEVYRILESLESIGVSIKWIGEKSIELRNPKKFDMESINSSSAGKTRSVIMFAGALIHNLSKFSIPNPKGCKLGKRTYAGHVFGLEELGVQVEATEDELVFVSKDLEAGIVTMFEAGDTSTENLIIAASLIPGKTKIRFGSYNYMVRDVIAFLKQAGVDVKINGVNEIEVNGIDEINAEIDFYISEDPIESMMFIAAAVVTNSSITIKRCPIDFLEIELYRLKKMGMVCKISDKYLSKNKAIDLVDIEIVSCDMKSLDEKIEPRPYPGINIDNLPFFVPIANMCTGKTLIHDWVYENRAIYYTEMSKVGMDVLLADPHRVYVTGTGKFSPAEVVCPPALRPAMIILLGMLGAQGESVLRNIYSISRGYEDISERLNSLGAKIEIM